MDDIAPSDRWDRGRTSAEHACVGARASAAQHGAGKHEAARQDAEPVGAARAVEEEAPVGELRLERGGLGGAVQRKDAAEGNARALRREH